MKDYYSILGVSRNVSPEILEAIYKNLKKTQGNEETLKEITEAYEVLSDPSKRKAYDILLNKQNSSSDDDSNSYDSANTKVNSNRVSSVDKVYSNSAKNTPYKSKTPNRVVTLIGTIIVIIAICLIMNHIITLSENRNTYSPKVKVTSENTVNNDASKDKDTSTVETKSEKKKKSEYNIKSASAFSDGIAFIQCENGDVFAIDTTGDSLFKIEDCDDLNSISEYKNGIFVFKDSMFDGKGTLIASPEKLGYDYVARKGWTYAETPNVNLNGYICVKKTILSYEGDYTAYGIVNKDGEWEIPLSEKGEWIYQVSPYLQHIYKWENSVLDIDEKHSVTKADKYFDEGYLVESDENSGEFKLFAYNGDVLFDSMDYDFDTSYMDTRFKYYNGYIAFIADNGTGSYYLFFLDKNKEFVMEPIRLSSDEDNIIYLGDEGIIYGYEGKVREFKGNYKLCSYDGDIHNFGENINYMMDFNNGLALAATYDPSEKDFFDSYDDVETKIFYINTDGETIIE